MAYEKRFEDGIQRIFKDRMEPIVRRLYEERGLSLDEELPQSVAAEIFRQAAMETSGDFPQANIEALAHGIRAFTNPVFQRSLSKVRDSLNKHFDAFDVAVGIDAAIVLSGLGLKVCPLDKDDLHPLGTLSNDFEYVAQEFSRCKTANVGYSPCELSFYTLITDCLKTLHERYEKEPEFQPIKELFERAQILPPTSRTLFDHGVFLFAREAGDKFSTVFLHDRSLNAGSTLLHAGWFENGSLEGTPNNGLLPVPMQLLSSFLSDASVAMGIWRPVNYRPTIN